MAAGTDWSRCKERCTCALPCGTDFFFFNNSGWLRITVIQTGVLEAIFPEG